MKMLRLRYFFTLLTLLTLTCFLITPAFAHVPVFEKGGENPETATRVEDPAKSRVIYGQLSGENARYYSFEVAEGERISLGLIIPVEEDKSYIPDLILIGPGLPDEGEIPEKVEAPAGYGTKVIAGTIPGSATYEGFTPSVFYSLARADLQAPESGTYYVAVSSVKEGGSYGIVMGYEDRLSLTEWLSLPLNQIRTYRWEGQNLPFIFFPFGMTLATGIFGILLKKEAAAELNPARWAGTFAGLIFLGTGLSLIFQMLYSLSRGSYSPEVIITVFFAIAGIVSGIMALVLSLKDERYGKRLTKKRIYFFILGFAGLLFWAGLIIGPILAFEASVLPWRKKG